MTTPLAVLSLSGWGYAELPLYGVLGSSLSSDTARRNQRISYEAPEDDI
jgi:hypothetical protein